MWEIGIMVGTLIITTAGALWARKLSSGIGRAADNDGAGAPIRRYRRVELAPRVILVVIMLAPLLHWALGWSYGPSLGVCVAQMFGQLYDSYRLRKSLSANEF